MTTVDPADALQAGLYALLSQDTELAALADVYDYVPEDAAMPYIVIGEMTSADDSAHGSPGRQTQATFHTWARARGFQAANEIGAAIVALLARQQADLDAQVADHTVWAIRHDFSQTLRDPDPEVRHRVDRFAIFTRQD
ncbi:MAG: DUF3168 domain-containing protein [Solirubrobacterales bacterium]|nr:DUF3168 domain-containing protein [Solirubrobacterales bacterium]